MTLEEGPMQTDVSFNQQRIHQQSVAKTQPQEEIILELIRVCNGNTFFAFPLVMWPSPGHVQRVRHSPPSLQQQHTLKQPQRRALVLTEDIVTDLWCPPVGQSPPRQRNSCYFTAFYWCFRFLPWYCFLFLWPSEKGPAKMNQNVRTAFSCFWIQLLPTALLD